MLNGKIMKSRVLKECILRSYIKRIYSEILFVLKKIVGVQNLLNLELERAG